MPIQAIFWSIFWLLMKYLKPKSLHYYCTKARSTTKTSSICQYRVLVIGIGNLNRSPVVQHAGVEAVAADTVATVVKTVAKTVATSVASRGVASLANVEFAAVGASADSAERAATSIVESNVSLDTAVTVSEVVTISVVELVSVAGTEGLTVSGVNAVEVLNLVDSAVENAGGARGDTVVDGAVAVAVGSETVAETNGAETDGAVAVDELADASAVAITTVADAVAADTKTDVAVVVSANKAIVLHVLLGDNVHMLGGFAHLVSLQAEADAVAVAAVSIVETSASGGVDLLIDAVADAVSEAVLAVSDDAVTLVIVVETSALGAVAVVINNVVLGVLSTLDLLVGDGVAVAVSETAGSKTLVSDDTVTNDVSVVQVTTEIAGSANDVEAGGVASLRSTEVTALIGGVLNDVALAKVDGALNFLGVVKAGTGGLGTKSLGLGVDLGDAVAVSEAAIAVTTVTNLVVIIVKINLLDTVNANTLSRDEFGVVVDGGAHLKLANACNLGSTNLGIDDGSGVVGRSDLGGTNSGVDQRSSVVSGSNLGGTNFSVDKGSGVVGRSDFRSTNLSVDKRSGNLGVNSDGLDKAVTSIALTSKTDTGIAVTESLNGGTVSVALLLPCAGGTSESENSERLEHFSFFGNFNLLNNNSFK